MVSKPENNTSYFEVVLIEYSIIIMSMLVLFVGVVQRGIYWCWFN
jgi:hypothetical protein